MVLTVRLIQISEEEPDLEQDIPLTKSQREILDEFYSRMPEPVSLTKMERSQIWKSFKEDRQAPSELNLETRCPALLLEIDKSIVSGKNIQSAVFSECVYSQALANVFELANFSAAEARPDWISAPVARLLDSYGLFPRYLYRNHDASRLLVQAGGKGGVDSALISVIDFNVFTIEFKESAAKTSEVDLPRYGEDGELVLLQEFVDENPQFEGMLREQVALGLNFWEHMGVNINEFSPRSIMEAVNENYAGKKFADVICTEDPGGNLVMIPSNQVSRWASLEGEIRPAGRNPYAVWTPRRLAAVIADLQGTMAGHRVAIPESRVVTSTARGGRQVSRYKLNPVFFVRAKDVVVNNGTVQFALENVSQLKPTIAAKMFFRTISHEAVRRHYMKTGD